MPYSNVPETLWGKMDRCVDSVMADGTPKPTAIAICYSSIMKKKVLTVITEQPLGEKVQVIGNQVRVQAPQCNYKDCEAAGSWEFSVEGKQLHYCDTHVKGAAEVLRRNKLQFEVKSIEGYWVTGEEQLLPHTKPDTNNEITQDCTTVVVSTKEYTGVIIALKPSIEVAEQLALPDGELPKELHVTLAYLGEASELEEQKETLQGVIEQLAKTAKPLTATISGITRFTSTHLQDKDALVLNIDIPELPEFRQAIVETLERLNFPVSRSHGFTPHMTLKYVSKDEEDLLPPHTEQPIAFNDLWLMWAGEYKSYPMVGEGLKQQVSPAQAIAERVNRDDVTPELVEEAFIIPWQQSTMNTPQSQQLQMVAAKTFGFQIPPEIEDVDINWDLLYPMGEMYNLTQEHLTGKGFSEGETIEVFHPYIPTAAVPKQWQKGDEVRIKLNPLTSWTMDIKEAIKFAEFLGAQGQPAFVIKTFIPVKSVVSLPETGIGLEGTSEIVLAGGEYEGIIEAKYE